MAPVPSGTPDDQVLISICLYNHAGPWATGRLQVFRIADRVMCTSPTCNASHGISVPALSTHLSSVVSLRLESHHDALTTMSLHGCSMFIQSWLKIYLSYNRPAICQTDIAFFFGAIMIQETISDL